MKLEGGRQSFIFMQDNASVHTANKNLQFLERNNNDLLDHPPLSPDFNPLENIWWAIEQALLDKHRGQTLHACARPQKSTGKTKAN